MALSSQQVWEVRTTGSDQNGGGFKAGATGTDYSQQDAAQVAFADLVIGATTTQLSSAASPFTAAYVGNVLNIPSPAATGFTPGRYEVVSVSGGVATMDRSVGTAGSAGGSGNLGGAIASLGTLASSMVAGNKAFVKGGTYNVTAGVTFTQSTTPGAGAPPTRVIGYATSRGDITPYSANQSSRPTLVANATIAQGITISNNGFALRNFILQAGTGSFTGGVLANGNWHYVSNVKVSGHGTSHGINLNGSNMRAFRCEVTAGTGGYGIAMGGNPNTAENCYVHDATNLTGGIFANNGLVSDCIVANLSGASTDGIAISGEATVTRNTIYSCGRHGIAISSLLYTGILRIGGNILANNGGYGLTHMAAAGVAAEAEWDGNSYYANTLGVRNNMDDTTLNAVDSVAPYANTRDVALTASPFVNAAGGDFRLNNNAGGGASCRGAGLAPSWPGLAFTASPDMGAAQHQDAGNATYIFNYIEG